MEACEDYQHQKDFLTTQLIFQGLKCVWFGGFFGGWFFVVVGGLFGCCVGAFLFSGVWLCGVIFLLVCVFPFSPLDEDGIVGFILVCSHFLLNFTFIASCLNFKCLSRIPMIISDNA